MATEAMAESPRDVDFDAQIKPILSDRCYFCHGPDANNRKAELRLDREADAKDYAIIPGKPDESELYRRITSDDPAERMPPPKSKLSLTKQEKEQIKRWIEQGAPWQEHWAFTPPRDVKIPEVKSKDWVRNEIDAFILHRIEEATLPPSEPASKERLIRRVTFDLTGLPPTLEEVDAFLKDDSPRAYEKLVDRLVKSERFGERMAADWLDVARYSDTYGFQVDRDRFVWPWRDWVIRAFNKNLPYDEFITQQLAGDLLPNATDDQILATTFQRLHPQKVEGGSVPEEFRIEYVADRTQTFGTAFLGLTLECCRCHDHKYDPISQKEYYQFSAFFDKIDEAGLYSFFTPAVPTPTLRLMDENAKRKLAGLKKQIAMAENQLTAVTPEQRAKFQEWLKNQPKPEIPGQVAHLDFEQHKGGANQSVPGQVGKAVKLSGDDGIGLKVGNFRRHEPFSVSLWMNTPDVKDRAVVFHRSRAWTDAGSRGYQLLIEKGRLSASLVHFWPGNAIRIRTREPIPTQQWLHVSMTNDGSSRANGLQIFIDGQPADCEVVRDHLYKTIAGGGGDNITIGQRFRDRGFKNGLVDEFQVFDRQLTKLEIQQLHDGNRLTNALANPDASETAELFAYFLSIKDETAQSKRAAIRKLREQRNKLQDGLQEIMVMQEMTTPRTTYLLKRGLYSARADAVKPETPEVFLPYPKKAPRNRLGLARWLTDPNHPLTSRVVVNRYWQMMFGQGLVRTPEDFGRQGAPPTHPKLLDWLARDFVQQGWDVKRLLKQIAMSATYRQSSNASKELILRDPENRLLARFSTTRLPAEMLRDNALTVSGLLVNRIGGPPAKPYEVEVSFKPTSRQKGEGLYRRSVYTYWKRTGPAPVMMTLDAAKRDVCRVRRERTSTPLQTFVLMNGPQFVEAARKLAERLLQKHPNDRDALLREIFRTLTSRNLKDRELKVLQKLFDQQQTYFQKNPERAVQYLKIGDSSVNAKLDKNQLAVAASVANALMSFDEAIMKR